MENNPYTMTQKRFARIRQDHLEKFDQNEGGFRSYLLCQVGSEERARQFLSSKGVSIGAFSKMVELPISTVRHYVRLGLIQPWIVDGKYRFDPVNLLQVESVRNWTDLGLSLEQIRERRTQQGAEVMVLDILGPLRAPDDVLEQALVDIRRTYGQDGYSENGRISTLDVENISEESKKQWNPVPMLKHLLEEYRQIRERLEQKQAEASKRVERIRQLEATLTPNLG